MNINSESQKSISDGIRTLLQGKKGLDALKVLALVAISVIISKVGVSAIGDETQEQQQIIDDQLEVESSSVS